MKIIFSSIKPLPYFWPIYRAYLDVLLRDGDGYSDFEHELLTANINGSMSGITREVEKVYSHKKWTTDNWRWNCVNYEYTYAAPETASYSDYLRLYKVPAVWHSVCKSVWLDLPEQYMND